MEDMSQNIENLLNTKKGRLSKDKIATGMHFCYYNAEELFQEAEILLRNKKMARGFGLLVLSLEELAKIVFLSNGIFIKEKDDAAWKKFWKLFSSHKLKQNIWLLYGKKRFVGTEREKYYRHSYSNNLPSLEKMKQLSFYVDYINGDPMIPSILLGHLKGLIGLVLKMVEDRLEAFRPLHSTLGKSRKFVALMSRIRIEGLSEEEIQNMIFESAEYISNYSNNKCHCLTSGSS
jgi:AbiV family abortive infection protein